MRTWILLIGLCSAAAAAAQTPLTRADAVARAWQKNLGLQVAQLQEQAAEVNNVWGAAGALPTVGITSSLSTAVSDQTRNPTSFIQARLGSQSFNSGANAAWTLYDGGGMFASKRSLELLAEQAGGQAALLAEQTAVAVLVAYDAVLVQQAFVAVLEESIALSRDRLAWSMARTELGVSSTFDRLQFENAVLADSSALLQQRLAVSTAVRNLNRLMGEQEDAVWALTSALDVPAAAPALPALRTEVLANARAVRNAVLAQSIAEVGIDQAEARLYPVGSPPPCQTSKANSTSATSANPGQSCKPPPCSP